MLFKSCIYFLSVTQHEKNLLKNTIGIKEKTSPFRYLSVPIVSSKLMNEECKPLLDKILCRINSWKSKSFSYMGKMTLIKAILFSVHIYWSSYFFLPLKVLKEDNGRLRALFWSGVDLNVHKAKVA